MVTQAQAARTAPAKRKWGGIAKAVPDLTIALTESDLQEYAKQTGFIKDATLAWVINYHKGRSATPFKATKQFCSGSKPVFKRSINPVFILMQALALEQRVHERLLLIGLLLSSPSASKGILCLLQGTAWSTEALVKDMLDLHDPACVAAVHAYKQQQAAKQNEPGPSLDDVYQQCLDCHIAWFEELLRDYCRQDMLKTVARTEAATQTTDWQFSDMPSQIRPADLLLAILRTSGLTYSEEQLSEGLSSLATAENHTVPQLVAKMHEALDSSTFLQLMLSHDQSAATAVDSFMDHNGPPTPECWRLFAITLQRDVFVFDMHYNRICCYPCHDGHVNVIGAADCSGHQNPWRMESWGQAGFYFVLSKLPLPQCLVNADCSVAVYVSWVPGCIHTTVRLAEPTLSAGQAATPADQDMLDKVGVKFADLRFEATGQKSSPEKAVKPVSAPVQAAREECMKLLRKLVGDTAPAQVSFKADTVAPSHDPSRVQLVSNSSCPAKLPPKDVATLAYLWNNGFLDAGSKQAVSQLIHDNIQQQQQQQHQHARGSPGTGDQDNLVQKVLTAAMGRWKPGQALTQKMRDSMHMKEAGSKQKVMGPSELRMLTDGRRDIMKLLKLLLGSDSSQVVLDSKLRLQPECLPAKEDQLEVPLRSPLTGAAGYTLQRGEAIVLAFCWNNQFFHPDCQPSIFLHLRSCLLPASSVQSDSGIHQLLEAVSHSRWKPGMLPCPSIEACFPVQSTDNALPRSGEAERPLAGLLGPQVPVQSSAGLESAEALAAAVELMEPAVGPPVRNSRRLQPAAAQPASGSHRKSSQYQHLKRKSQIDEADGCLDDDAEDEEVILPYNTRRSLCNEALACDRNTVVGLETFLRHACTFMEGLGLCSDDCLDESSRLANAPAFEQRMVVTMERFVADPPNTMKAYCAKFNSFLEYKMARQLEAALQQDADVDELHSRNLLVRSSDYLDFLQAVEDGRAGLGVSSRDKAKRRKVEEQELDADEWDQILAQFDNPDEEPADDSADPNVVSPARSTAPRRRPLGNSTTKQYLCAVGYLEQAQHHLLYGDMTGPKLSSLSILTTDARTRRRLENKRKTASLMDAARHAPELRDPVKEKAFIDFEMSHQTVHKQLKGLRSICLFLYLIKTAGRGEAVRSVRVCQRLNMDVTPVEDHMGSSLQIMELLAFTKDTGKTSSGDKRELAAIVPDRDALNCFHMAHAMYWGLQTLFMGRPLPDVSSKQKYYQQYMFSASPSTSTSPMTLVAHSNALKEGFTAAGYAANGLLTHRFRHDVPTELRLKYDVGSEEISVLGGWDASIKTQVYARLPSGNLLAKLSGCPSRQGYVVFWTLLDPLAMLEVREMVQKVYPHVPELLEKLTERNKKCPQVDRDVAGTHVLDGLLRDARKIFQGGPFWERQWPDFMLWKASCFQQFKSSGVWDRWCDMQLSFCASLERASAALRHPAYGVLSQSSQCLVLNHWLKHKAQFLQEGKVEQFRDVYFQLAACGASNLEDPYKELMTVLKKNRPKVAAAHVLAPDHNPAAGQTLTEQAPSSRTAATEPVGDAAAALMSLQQSPATSQVVANIWESPPADATTSQLFRQLRHQLRHTKQQHEQQTTQLTGQVANAQDVNQIVAFKLQQLETLVSGTLGLSMEMFQKQMQAGQLLPASAGPVAQRHLDLSSNKKLSAAAQQRQKAEQRWHQKHQKSAIRALQQQAKQLQRQDITNAGQGPAVNSAGEQVSDPEAEHPASPAAEQAASQETVSGQLRHADRPAHFPMAIVPGHDQLLWTQWGGKYQTLLDYKQLRWLYSDWVDGIRLADPDPSVVKRAAPLRWLEDQTRQLGKQFVWRSGPKMTKAVNQRKVIVYGILRHLENPRADVESGSAELQEAIQALEEFRNIANPKGPLTNMKLYEALIDKYGTPVKFEQEVLGWEAPNSMPNGNPKHKVKAATAS